MPTKKTSRDHKRPPFFVPERRARSASARAVVDVVQQQLARWEADNALRRRARKAADQRRHQQMVEALVCDVAHRNVIAPGGTLALSLGRQQKSRYAPSPYEPMKSLLEMLGQDGLGYLMVTWGHKPDEGLGSMTTIAASPLLLELTKGLVFADFGRRNDAEPIFLRNTKRSVNDKGGDDIPDAFQTWVETGAEVGQFISYKDSPLAKRLRHEMRSITRWLDDADVTCGLARDREERLVDVGDRWMRRVFNNGHSDFRHGGRLVGGFWMQLSKEERLRSISISGEPVGEVDFKAMMPRLLYAHVGQAYAVDDDPYDIKGIPRVHRDGIKKVFSALLFGPAALRRYPKGCRTLLPKQMACADVVELMKRQHPTVASQFGTRIGFQLMRTESDILVDVLLAAQAHGFVVLPVHDAVICPLSRLDLVERLMLAAFRNITGSELAAVSKSQR